MTELISFEAIATLILPVIALAGLLHSRRKMMR